jgi:3-hydroxymyristoyl/3-hydroxydecanoyl-(acyl carrier protein) dehydratase
VSGELSEEAREIFRRAERGPLLANAEARRGAGLGRAEIEALLPHRHPFLLLDRVDAIDRERGLVAARYDLARARDVLAGHFPARAVWPGVLQVEAIAQAGLVLHLAREEGTAPPAVALTHVLGARFLRPVEPGGDVEIQAAVLEDGLFFTIVGQCLRDGAVCSVAAVSGLGD